jgi:hypothetical protein
MENGKTEEQQGYMKFHSCIGPLGAKEAPEGQRVLCACFLVRNMIWHLLREQESRDAIEAAEKFARGETDRKAFLKARRNAKAAYERIPEGFLRQAANQALWVTLTPFGWTMLRGLASMMSNLLANQFQQENPGISWDQYRQTEEKAYFAMAELALKFQNLPTTAATEARSLLDDPHLSKYFRRYFNPYDTRESVSLNVKDTSRRKRLLHAIQCFLDVAVRSTFSARDLAPMKSICESAIRGDREIGIELLISLGAHHQPARDVLFELLDASRAEIRFTAISHFGFLHLPYPKEFVVRVIEKAIDDVSSKVRRFASQAASDYAEIKETVPLLERRIAKETNEEVKRGLEYDLPLLRDGYRVAKNPDGTYSVSVRTKQGIGCIELPKKDLEPKRFKKIIEKMRSGEIVTSGIIEYDSGIEA